jgi:hypothetical protein
LDDDLLRFESNPDRQLKVEIDKMMWRGLKVINCFEYESRIERAHH